MIDISKTELEVMQAVWQTEPACSADIVKALQAKKEWHEKTVKTLLGRLVKKQALAFEKEGRQYLYSTLISEKEYQMKEGSSFITRLFSGKITPLIAGFAQQEELKKEDVEELKKIIRDWEQKNG